jgi:hypothetical protein
MTRPFVVPCVAFLSIAAASAGTATAADAAPANKVDWANRSFDQRKRLMKSTVVFPLSADDRDREEELRARFAQFWSKATGDRRTIYDTFISATPLAKGVSLEHVESRSVRGWWV